MAGGSRKEEGVPEKSTEPKHVRLGDLPVTAVREGVVRHAVSGEGATVAWTTLQPGHEPRPHSHPYEQIVVILAGRAIFHVDGAEVSMACDHVLVIPAGVEHYAVVVGDEPVVDLSIFTPRRDEYATPL